MHRITLLLVLAACTPPDPEDTPPELSTTATTTTTTATTTTTTTSTTTAFDCSTIPDLPLSTTPLDAPRGYNDLVFDADGTMIGSDDTALIQATSAIDSTVYAAGTGTVYKMAHLPSGEIVANHANGDVIRVYPNGAADVLTPNLQGYGLAIGRDGMIYVGTNYTSGWGNGIVRIDPATGDAFLWQSTPADPRAIAFSRDGSVLYFGTHDGGHVFKTPLDANNDPASEPVLLVTLPSAWHDTLEVDACGNLYVGAFMGWQVFRIVEDLSFTEIMSWNFNNYGHGFEWGVAAGGWDEQSVYVTHPYVGSRVDQWELGVPGAAWPGQVVGGFTL